MQTVFDIDIKILEDVDIRKRNNILGEAIIEVHTILKNKPYIEKINMTKDYHGIKCIVLVTIENRP